jgi:NADH dehydrogenase FAD-containing subunit
LSTLGAPSGLSLFRYTNSDRQLSPLIFSLQRLPHAFKQYVVVVLVQIEPPCPKLTSSTATFISNYTSINIVKMTQRNIVILGGSYSGISTAHYLLKHAIPQLLDKTSYLVVIVSTSSQAICRPACPRALISDDMFAQEQLFVSIPDSFEQYAEGSFRFIHGTAADLDHDKRMVSIRSANGDTEVLDFHALVIATGASTPSPLLGLNGSEEHLRESWDTFRKALPTAKSIIIAGGGPAGIETAGELGEHINGRAGWFSSALSNPKVSVTVVTSGSRILPALRPAIAKKAEEYLAKVGLTVIKDAQVKTVEPHGAGTVDVAAKATLTLENGKTLETNLYIPATGTRPNTSFMDKALLTAGGRVDTNVSTLRVNKGGPRIYAIGDAASYARPAIHLILNAIPVLCANIKRDLLVASGKEEISVGVDRHFVEDTRETQLVPIGTNKGVGAAMGWQVPSFMVWLIKGWDYWLWTTGGLWSGKQWAKES